ncbi:MAG: TolC family protein [Nitrospirae bacterium]|nr:MAG: TolC family protein [Nitrospirota bacterium]
MRPIVNSKLNIQHLTFIRLLPVMLAVALPVVVAAAEETTHPMPKAVGAFLGYKTAIQIGLEQHPLVKKSQESALAADALTQQAKAKYYPQIDAYAIQTGGNVRPLSAFNIAGAQNKPTSYIQNAGMIADQMIYDFGQTAHTVLAERANQAAAEKNVLTHKALVILTVQQAYLDCLRQKRLVQVAEQTVKERGVFRDHIALLHKRQLKSKLDLDLISVELRNAEVLLVQANNNLRSAFAALNNAMGVRGPDGYTLEDVPVILSSVDTLEALTQAGLSQRPELLNSADRIRSSEERLKSAQSLYLPTISAAGMGGVIHFSDAPTNQDPGATPGFTQTWWGAAATLSLPLFTGFLIENKVAEARQQKYKEEQKKTELSNKVVLEVTEAYLTLQTAKQQTKVAEQEVATARNALALAGERYRLGLASIVDLTTATTSLISAEVQLADTNYALQASAAAVAFATGTGYREF